MKTKHLITILLTAASAFLFTSCEEVIEINLNDSTPVINAEGSIEPGSTAVLRLRYSTDFFEPGDFETIEDAIVTIEDDSENSERLFHQGGGLYTGSELAGEIGKTYTLRFTHEGQTYSAESELKPASQILDAYFSEADFNRPIDTAQTYNMNVKFTNDESMENYYVILFQINGQPYRETNFTFEGNLLSQNGIIDLTLVRTHFYEGDTVLMKLCSVDKDTYTYYNQLNDQLNSGLRGSSTPYNPISNFGQGVMGYFEARSVSYWQGVIE